MRPGLGHRDQPHPTYGHPQTVTFAVQRFPLAADARVADSSTVPETDIRAATVFGFVGAGGIGCYLPTICG